MKFTFEVTGVIPVGKISRESKAFKKVDFPLENCPTIATSIGYDARRRSLLKSSLSCMDG